ncbi:Chlorophyllide a oxygenase, chloroplastic [Zea mays]|uniref:Chlorophyllide a oxygenase, chloroplastic n=1 Tax=Zea mays TaxID=4577 RepID=A0A3L6DSI3_MAIZE|nr:Chlorophyllide a oxygenase, chloroplastic [Zea mays]
MPSTKMLNVRIQSLPCFEQEGMVWIWPGDDPPKATIPSLLPPSGFTVHAEIVMELPVEHGLLLDNLLDLAHAPFTHTSTFAKGWSVPSTYRSCTCCGHISQRRHASQCDKVLNEDLRLVLGQQERMINGANVWNWPVSYDKLGVRYRLWRDTVERGSERLPFSNQAESGS